MKNRGCMDQRMHNLDKARINIEADTRGSDKAETFRPDTHLSLSFLLSLLLIFSFMSDTSWYYLDLYHISHHHLTLMLRP